MQKYIFQMTFNYNTIPASLNLILFCFIKNFLLNNTLFFRDITINIMITKIEKIKDFTPFVIKLLN